MFQTGKAIDEALCGASVIQRWTWNQVVLVRDQDQVAVYLNGDSKPEIMGRVTSSIPPAVSQFFVGGCCDGSASFEGRIDEVAIYDRALTGDEVAQLYSAAVAK